MHQQMFEITRLWILMEEMSSRKVKSNGEGAKGPERGGRGVVVEDESHKSSKNIFESTDGKEMLERQGRRVGTRQE